MWYPELLIAEDNVVMKFHFDKKFEIVGSNRIGKDSNVLRLKPAIDYPVL